MSLPPTALTRCGLLLAAAALLSACAVPGSGPMAARYRCEHGIDFSVRFVDDNARLEGPRANEVLFRDAGGHDTEPAANRGARHVAATALALHRLAAVEAAENAGIEAARQGA